MAINEMVFAFSGFRDESLKSQIEAAGGKVMATLGKHTTHLIVKKGAKPSKKLDEAEEKGVKLVDLNEFLAEHEFVLGEKKKVEKKTPEHSDHSGDEEKPAKPAKKTSKKSTIAKIDAMIEEMKQLKALLESE